MKFIRNYIHNKPSITIRVRIRKTLTKLSLNGLESTAAVVVHPTTHSSKVFGFQRMSFGESPADCPHGTTLHATIIIYLKRTLGPMSV